jgi:hypothetical protein
MARQLALGAAEELGQALETGTPAGALLQAESDPVARFRADVLAAEGAVAAPALVPLPAAELGSAILLLARLADESAAVGGDGKLVNALSAAVSRRARRRLRRILSEPPGTDAHSELARIDWSAWRVELRTFASCAVLAGEESELRSAFLAWLPADDADARALPREADIREQILAAPEGHALLRWITSAWVAALLRRTA